MPSKAGRQRVDSRMKILAFDTSSHACSVALLAHNKITMKHEEIPMQHAQCILPFIDYLVKSQNIQLNQLDAIAFGCGPGSFTGIRIATSIAQGLSYGLQIPLIPISSLAAIAQTAYNELGWDKLFVAIDARIQEIYCARYHVKSNQLVELMDEEQVCSPSEFSFQEAGWNGVGNAWKIYVNELKYQPIQTDPTQLPKATAIIQLAIPRFEKQAFVNAGEALPVYLRNEVARKEKKR